jgi:hypothetical protein
MSLLASSTGLDMTSVEMASVTDITIPVEMANVAGRARRTSIFGLAGIVTSAFNRVEPRGALGRLAFWVATVIALCAYERRVHSSGKAICLLRLRRARVVTAGAGLVALEVITGAVSPVAALCLLAATAAVFLPLGAAGVRALPARLRLARQVPARTHAGDYPPDRLRRAGLRLARQVPARTHAGDCVPDRLRRTGRGLEGGVPRGCPGNQARVPGRHVYLHSLASTQPGAGAALLGRVCAEADLRGWWLMLDAGAERLVSYYRAFGFEPCGNAMHLPNGQLCLRMRRAPGPNVRVVEAGAKDARSELARRPKAPAPKAGAARGARGGLV